MSAVHDQDAVSYFGDGAQVMGDEQHGGIFLLFDTDKFFQNLVLGDGIDGGGRLIGNQKLRLQGHGNADHDTLEHAAGKLVWVFFQNLFSVSDPHLFQNFQRAGAISCAFQEVWVAKVSAIWSLRPRRRSIRCCGQRTPAGHGATA